MPKLTDDDRAERARLRMLETARAYSTGTYLRKFVSPLYQRMRRAEFAAEPLPFALAIVNGELASVDRSIGECVCVTCGKVQNWDSGIKGMHTGHFLASRRNSILLEDENTYPQCSGCNFYRSGAPQEFRKYMLEMKGPETIERLERLKTESRSFGREELVDMRIRYQERLNNAIERMKG